MLSNGLSSKTVETLLSHVSAVCKHAKERGWCGSNAARGACTEISKQARRREAASGQDSQPRCLDPQARKKLIEALDDKRYRHYAPIIKFLLHTGLRASELCGLTEEDVDVDEVRVRRGLRYKWGGGASGYVVDDPKTPSSRRDLPLSSAARADLTEWRSLGMTCVNEPCGLKGIVFTKEKGSALTYAAINKVLHRVAKEVNEREGREVIPAGLSSHWLRHTFVTDAIESGMPAVAVSHYVGHEDIRVTMRVYYCCRKSYMQASVAMLDGIEAHVSSSTYLGPSSTDSAMDPGTIVKHTHLDEDFCTKKSTKLEL